MELAARSEIHRSTIYRYLSVLVQKGYVKNKNGKYSLGPRFLELASLFLERLNVRAVAHSYLVKLAESLHVTVHLGQLEGHEVLYIDKVETYRSLPLYSRVGRKVPAHCTALGKALLAFSAPEKVEMLLKQMDFRAYTDRTIVDPEALLKELWETKARGYAVDREEHEEGIACIAAPIFDFYGEPVAAVSITELSRELLKNEHAYAREVVKAAMDISRKMGAIREQSTIASPIEPMSSTTKEV